MSELEKDTVASKYIVINFLFVKFIIFENAFEKIQEL